MAASQADGEITVLNAGAPKTGVARCAEAFAEARGRHVAVMFATAPAIREAMQSGDCACEVVIAPVPAMQAFEQAGRIVAASTLVIGKIKAGVVVRNGAPTPNITTVESLTAACRAADSLLYNEAPSGQRIAEMMVQLGIADEVADKTVRVPTGRAVMEHLAQSRAAREIGFGHAPDNAGRTTRRAVRLRRSHRGGRTARHGPRQCSRSRARGRRHRWRCRS